MDLVYKNEKKLFAIASIISAIFWLAIVVGTFGIVLIYLLFGYLFFLFSHSAFITYLKGTGVKIGPNQYPDLHERLLRSSQKVGLSETPEAYILRTDFFNALATKFLGRHFVVLFSDVIDALEDQPGAVDFYIGHELGHIHRKHLSWRVFLFPAMFMPLLGSALRRAEEYTCDRYGVACCDNTADISAALAAIAAGDSRWQSINVDAYLSQVQLTDGFWMSYNELTSDYPWLTKRMATAIALSKGEEIEHPSRHSFAWFLSLLTPRVGIGGQGAGGLVSLMIVVAVIGILAAVALPAYQDYVEKARVVSAYTDTSKLTSDVESYVMENQVWPTSLEDLGHSNVSINPVGSQYEIGIFADGMIGAEMGETTEGLKKYLVLQPAFEEEGLSWSCFGQNIPEAQLPQACRQ